MCYSYSHISFLLTTKWNFSPNFLQGRSSDVQYSEMNKQFYAAEKTGHITVTKNPYRNGMLFFHITQYWFLDINWHPYSCQGDCHFHFPPSSNGWPAPNAVSVIPTMYLINLSIVNSNSGRGLANTNISADQCWALDLCVTFKKYSKAYADVLHSSCTKFIFLLRNYDHLHSQIHLYLWWEGIQQSFDGQKTALKYEWCPVFFYRRWLWYWPLWGRKYQ